jgi:hypothetical protein
MDPSLLRAVILFTADPRVASCEKSNSMLAQDVFRNVSCDKRTVIRTGKTRSPERELRNLGIEQNNS